MGHVPNIEECTVQFGHRLHAIMDRYSHVVSFGVFSHLHWVQYQVISDLIKRQPIIVNFLTSSATTYKGKPPSFDVIYLDPDTMRPVDYEVYAMDLDLANEKDQVKWSRYLDYRTEYGMKDLRPSNFYKLSNDFWTDEEACKKYARNRFLNGPGYMDTGAGKGVCWYVEYYCQTTASEEEGKYYCEI